jgi:hypothetical protein
MIYLDYNATPPLAMKPGRRCSLICNAFSGIHRVCTPPDSLVYYEDKQLRIVHKRRKGASTFTG